jgi:choline-sulfatase
MYQKSFEAYEETVRVPLIIWNKHLFKGPRLVDALTNHVDLAPTLLGLAGIDPEPIRQQLARDHSDARPFVGRDLSPLILGEVDPASVNDPVYFMTDDNPTLGLHQSSPDGTTNPAVVQPSHVETVVARLDDGKLWKYSRYFDSPQFWSSPGTPGDEGVKDVIVVQKKATPDTPDYGEPDRGPQPTRTDITVKSTPKPDEFELYDVTEDPMELDNKYNNAGYSAQQAALEVLLQEQCAQKRLTPCSGDVPGDPNCDQDACSG